MLLILEVNFLYSMHKKLFSITTLQMKVSFQILLTVAKHTILLITLLTTVHTRLYEFEESTKIVR